MKDKRFLPAFYLAVRDTLVAETLEQASRLAYGTTKRFRVVTLEGQLIEASGTMSGGGNRKAKGGMAASLATAVSAEQMRALETEERELSATLGDVRERQQANAASLQKAGKQLQKLRTLLAKTEARPRPRPRPRPRCRCRCRCR